MRVLVITGNTHFGRGGVQRETEYLLAGLASQNIPTALLVDKPLDQINIEYFDIEYPPRKKSRGQILDAVTRFRPDLIHVIGGGFLLLSTVNKLVTGIPWSLTVHNVPPYERNFNHFHRQIKLYYFLRNLLAMPSHLLWKKLFSKGHFCAAICHSKLIAREIRTMGCPPEKIKTIPLPATLEKTDNEREPGLFRPDAFPKILTVAATSFSKGIHDFLISVSELKQHFPELQYCLIGASRYPRYKRFLLSEIVRLNLESYVILKENISDSARLATLCKSDLYVQPSHEEGFCITYMEAAFLVPRIIGTETGAMPEISGKNDPYSIIVRPGFPSALTNAALTLLNAEAPDTQFMEFRRTRLLSRYSMPQYINAHVKLFTHLTGTLKSPNQRE